MRGLWTVVRLVLVLAAAGVTFVTPFLVVGPGGTSIDQGGALIDAVALVVIVAVLWSLWRDRRALF